jgi:hypothetical protein
MILIRKNSTNNVVLTLNEQAEVDMPYSVLFEFTNDTTGEVKLFTTVDISPATSRFNQFHIDENFSENLEMGIVSLSPSGYWSYNLYEMTPVSPVDLDPINALSILESGKVLVIEEMAMVDPTFNSNDTINNVVFDEEMLMRQFDDSFDLSFT